MDFAELKPADRAQRDSQLAQLTAEGYAVGPSEVIALSPQGRTRTRNLWARMWTAKADEYWDQNAYVSVTVIDDGDSTTYEAFAYAHEYSTGLEVWGVVQGLIDDPLNAWVFNDGSGLAENGGGLDKLLGLVCPTVEAAICTGFDGNTALKNALVAGVTSGFSGLFTMNLTCWSGGASTVAVCFGGGFLRGFGWNLGYALYDYGSECLPRIYL